MTYNNQQIPSQPRDIMPKRTAKMISIIELLNRFSTEEKAVKWLEQVAWPEKPTCPHCGGVESISKGTKPHSYWHKVRRLAAPLSFLPSPFLCPRLRHSPPLLRPSPPL